MRPLVALALIFFAQGLFLRAQNEGQARLPDPQKLLEAEKFWQNRDFSWYRQNIPFFECPDSDIQTTW